MMGFWVKNTAGRKDAMLTFSILAFVVVIIKFLASGLAFQIHGHDVNCGQVDAAAIAALLTPTLGAYVARRHSETKYGDDPGGGEKDDPTPEPAHDPKG